MLRSTTIRRITRRARNRRWQLIGRSILIAGASCLAVLLIGPWRSGADATVGDTIVDAAGNISVPPGYRESYQYLGSWAVAEDQGQSPKEMHTVYASPGLIAAHRKDGRFPDGSVLVKEVFETAAEAMTTGAVSYSRNLKGWFVMVRDSSDGRAANKLWGDGWGWSWFDASNPRKTTSTDFKADCQGCHLPAKASDWVFVQGYPPLTR